MMLIHYMVPVNLAQATRSEEKVCTLIKSQTIFKELLKSKFLPVLVLDQRILLTLYIDQDITKTIIQFTAI